MSDLLEKVRAAFREGYNGAREKGYSIMFDEENKVAHSSDSGCEILARILGEDSHLFIRPLYLFYQKIH